MPRRRGNPNWANGTVGLLPGEKSELCQWEKMLAAEGLGSDQAALEELKKEGARAARIKSWVETNRTRFVPLVVLDALGMREEADVVGW